MEKGQEKQQDITIQETKETKAPEATKVAKQSTAAQLERYRRWLQMAFFAILVLSGQSAATLLGRLYFEKGGKSKWMETLVQTAGFPILLPFIYFTRNKDLNEGTKSPSALALGSIYVVLGVFLAVVCMLFSVGLLYLPVSTFSLITATQLGFNAFFSFFLNSQKFTPYIVNSVVLLTTSSALLVFQTDSSGTTKAAKGKYIAGFICTLCAAASYSLMLSLTQLAFTKVIKRQTVKELVDFIIYQALVATCVIVIGLFASGEWKTLNKEMNEYELGKASYMLNLIWTALCWQIFSVGMLGLLVKASALFANVISTLCLPIVPILAVIIFKDKMTGVKVVSMFLAIWGFVSYIYQHYLDDLKFKTGNQNVSSVPEIPLIERA